MLRSSDKSSSYLPKLVEGILEASFLFSQHEIRETVSFGFLLVGLGPMGGASH